MARAVQKATHNQRFCLCVMTEEVYAVDWLEHRDRETITSCSSRPPFVQSFWPASSLALVFPVRRRRLASCRRLERRHDAFLFKAKQG